MFNFQLFINTVGLCLTLAGMILSLSILLFILISIRPLKSNIPLILTCNSYAVSFASSLIIFIGYCYELYNITHPSPMMENSSCQIFAYFIYIALGNLFYSLVLQAIYRLLRIVFFAKISWRTLKIFAIAIVFQWISVFVLNFPFLLLKDFQYIPSEYRCQVSYTNARASLMVLFIEYFLPTNIIFSIYFYIIRYIRRTNRAMIHRQNTVYRQDILVFKQILFILFIAQLLFTPLLILWILYLTIDYLTPLSYQLQALTIAFCQALIPLTLAFSTPILKKKFTTRLRRIRPFIVAK